MRLKYKILTLSLLLILGIFGVINSVSAVEKSKVNDIKVGTQKNNDSRKWTVVTFSESLNCGDTSKIAEIGDYQQIKLYLGLSANNINCDVIVEASPDKNIWQEIEFFRIENGLYPISDTNIPVLGPYYRIRTANGTGDITFKAYIFADWFYWEDN